MSHDNLGDRMKEQYESRTRYMLPRRTYTIIRLDGKAFHSYTKGMRRPEDHNFIKAMNCAAANVVKELQGAKCAYVQSDEISILLTDFDKITTEAAFNGNLQKICSVSASIATAHFNQVMREEHDMTKFAYFDSRVFTIPDPVEVQNYFIWRQNDCVRNSLSMLAQFYFSHKDLQGKSQSDMHEMLHGIGVNWANMSEGFKNGRFYCSDVGLCAAPNFKTNRLPGVEF